MRSTKSLYWWFISVRSCWMSPFVSVRSCWMSPLVSVRSCWMSPFVSVRSCWMSLLVAGAFESSILSLSSYGKTGAASFRIENEGRHDAGGGGEAGLSHGKPTGAALHLAQVGVRVHVHLHLAKLQVAVGHQREDRPHRFHPLLYHVG